MSKGNIVWSSDGGDQRKKNNNKNSNNEEVNESELTLHLRRLTTGKGRTVIEVSSLPNNKNWCKKLAKELKKSLGAGGSYKDNVIEVHGELMDKVMAVLEKKRLAYKKTGG